MSTAREKAAAKAARLSQRPTTASGSKEPRSVAGGPQKPSETRSGATGTAGTTARGRTDQRTVTERSGMVRTTVDLAPAMHRELRDLLADVAAELGRTRITASDAHRVLVRRLLRDPDMRSQFLEDCRDQL